MATIRHGVIFKALILSIKQVLLVFAVNLAFEESVYEVSESIANRSLHLALQVCVTHSNPGLPRPAAGQFTLRFVTSSGTALGEKFE